MTTGRSGAGFSVLGSAKPEDESLLLACKLVENMLSKRDDVRQELIRRKARFAIIGRDEGTAYAPVAGVFPESTLWGDCRHE